VPLWQCCGQGQLLPVGPGRPRRLLRRQPGLHPQGRRGQRVLQLRVCVRRRVLHHRRVRPGHAAVLPQGRRREDPLGRLLPQGALLLLRDAGRVLLPRGHQVLRRRLQGHQDLCVALGLLGHPAGERGLRLVCRSFFAEVHAMQHTAINLAPHPPTNRCTHAHSAARHKTQRAATPTRFVSRTSAAARRPTSAAPAAATRGRRAAATPPAAAPATRSA
jgi:hypothetical protein